MPPGSLRPYQIPALDTAVIEVRVVVPLTTDVDLGPRAAGSARIA